MHAVMSNVAMSYDLSTGPESPDLGAISTTLTQDTAPDGQDATVQEDKTFETSGDES